MTTGPVVLFFDGHVSHLALDLLKEARNECVHLYTLLSNTTHVLQPLDVAVYVPVKTAWRKVLQEYKIKTRASNADNKVFGALLAKLLNHSVTPSQLRAGFSATGICPFNPKAVPNAKISTLIPFTSPSKRRPRDDIDSPLVPVTPVRAYLTGYLTAVLQPKLREPRKQPRQRMKPSFHGEVLTQNEIFERIEAAEAEKAAAKRNQRW